MSPLSYKPLRLTTFACTLLCFPSNAIAVRWDRNATRGWHVDPSVRGACQGATVRNLLYMHARCHRRGVCDRHRLNFRYKHLRRWRILISTPQGLHPSSALVRLKCDHAHFMPISGPLVELSKTSRHLACTHQVVHLSLCLCGVGVESYM